LYHPGIRDPRASPICALTTTSRLPPRGAAAAAQGDTEAGGPAAGGRRGVRPVGWQLPAVAAAGSRTAPSRTSPFTGCAARANPVRREAGPGGLARGGSERRAAHGRKE